jgi:hypothetical protein
MKLRIDSKWSLGLLAATVMCAIGDVIVAARQRRQGQEVARQIQGWENEGGAAAPSVEHA